MQNRNMFAHVTSRYEIFLPWKQMFDNDIARNCLQYLHSLQSTQPNQEPSKYTWVGTWLSEVDCTHVRQRHSHHFVSVCHVASRRWHVWDSEVKLLAPCCNLGRSNRKSGHIDASLTINVQTFKTAMSKSSLFGKLMRRSDGSNATAMSRINYQHQYF